MLLLAITVCPQLTALGNDFENAAVETGHLIDNGAYAVEKANRLLIAHNLDGMYIPASIVKIATALTALGILGPEYRFETHFYMDSASNIYIKGFGDPFLVSEELELIIDNLKKRGVHAINNIYLDQAAFQHTLPADGLGLSDNPYDALNSALAVNFNTVRIQVAENGLVQSAEEQTPTLPLMQQLGKDMKPGSYRVNISINGNNGQTVISRYVGELFRAIQEKKDMPGKGKIAERTVPKNLEPFYMHRSGRSLLEIIEPLMLYSNNFMANQLFLACGAKEYGYPATWDKGRRALAGFMREKLDLSEKAIKMVEGSGLSRKNRVSPSAMLTILHAFKPYGHLLPLEDNKRIKSGTLKGVYSYSGYFMDSGELDSFVLILNQSGNKRDKLLGLLEGYYRRLKVRSED